MGTPPAIGAAAMAMPQHLMVRINVGGQVFHTSLHTVMEGARLGKFLLFPKAT
jgi:hypothetical protein